MEFVRDMWNEGWPGRLLLTLCVVLAGLVPIIIWTSIQEDREWEAFKASQSCKIIAQVSGSTGTGFGTTIGTNGQVGFGPVVVSVPGKTGWQCADGVTYWR